MVSDVNADDGDDADEPGRRSGRQGSKGPCRESGRGTGILI
jgi:hypothetical protein